MLSHRESFKTILGLLFIATHLTGCSGIKNDQQHNLRVSWDSNLTILPLLAEEAESKTQEDLKALLNKTWYAPIQVQHAKITSIHTIDNCNTYFENNTPTMQPLKANENGPFLELRIMCEVTKLLASANSAAQTFLPGQILTPNLPYQLPKHVSFISSQTELNTAIQDKSKQVWADVNDITEVTKTSENQLNFVSSEGIQQLSIAGRGDMNGDDIEDILLVSRDSIPEASYFNIRLFVLSVDSQEKWHLLQSYHCLWTPTPVIIFARLSSN